MSSREVIAASPPENARRFYRPELDALRFFAFLAVLIHHGPGSPGLPDIVSHMGGFGLSMFFLLSAYLITELLIREREQTGTVAWNLFFARRALRIWPLYYAALMAGVVFSRIPPHRFWITRTGILAMIFFVANWIKVSQLSLLVGPLWSISIEEQFYLIWPPVVKAGGKALALAVAVFFVVSAGGWLWVFIGRGTKLWYDTPVEFLFFAAGAIIAIATHGKRPDRTKGPIRAGLLIAGVLFLVVASQAGVGYDNSQPLAVVRLYVGYGAAVVGCVSIFFAILGLSRVPRILIYPGKISYGLYVFHAASLLFAERLTWRFRRSLPSVFYMFAVDVLALLLCLLAAHVSYRYFETPFLRLKERFAVILSRPPG